MIGKIKKVFGNKGYGFISYGEEEFWFHVSHYNGNFLELALISPPNTDEGPEVLFQEQKHPKGLRAIKVELIETS